MTTKPTLEWTSVHLYYEGEATQFLSLYFFPLLHHLQTSKYVDDYFFIKYFDTAPHIRFRFKTLTQHVSTCLDEISNCLPKDCQVKRQAYSPEMARYGGNHFIAIAERQFFASSEACRQLMLASDIEWNYNTGLSYALQMNLSMVHTLGLDLNEAQVFFEKVAQAWIGFVIPDFYKKTLEEQNKAKKTAFDGFAQLYQRSAGLKAMIQNLWEALSEEGEFGEPWLDGWIEAMQHTLQNYEKLQTVVEVDPAFLLPELPNHCLAKANLFALANSFVHMNNNRLGVYNQDESYLAFAIAQSLKGLTK